MSTRNRREYKEKPTEEKVVTLDQALSIDRSSAIYERISEVIREHGTDLFLKIRLISSDYRTAGFLDDISSTDEIQTFIENPESYLKSRYGDGSYRIDFLDGVTKKYISHIKIDISSPKEKIINRPPQISFDEITRARKEGRQEILELANLIKPTSNQTQQQPIDLAALFKFLGDEQNKVRERELELRREELAFLKETLNRNQNFNEQFKPMFDFMGSISGVFKNVMGVVDRSVQLAQDLSPVPEEPSLKGFLYEIGKNLLSSNPNFLKGIVLSNPNIPNMTKNPLTANIPLENNPSTENKTPKEESNREPQKNQFNFETAFQFMLLNQIERATMDIEPDFCAECLLTDLEVLSKKGLITLPQVDQAHKLLISDHLETYARNFFPDIVKYKAWLINFQSAIKEGISEPQEDTPEGNRQ